MYWVASANQIHNIEEEAVRQQGITLRDLMEKAGKSIAEEAIKGLEKGMKVLVISGKGNNGGDGFVAARYIAEAGYKVEVFCLCSKQDLPSDSRNAFDNIPESVTINLLSEGFYDHLEKSVLNSDLIIDSILGIGLNGQVRGSAEDVISIINESDKKVISVDIPSGVESDTGQIGGQAVMASTTVTFIAPKIGTLIYPGASNTGNLIVSSLDVPQEIIEKMSSILLINREVAAGLLPKRDKDIHKNLCGRILVLAGSTGMTGAAYLTSLGAIRIGAGIVTLGIPTSLNEIMEIKLNEVMTLPLPETINGSLDTEAYERILEVEPSFDVCAIGPGLSLDNSTVKLVQRLISELKIPIILDADGINSVVGKIKILKQREAPLIITPHPGELARLFSISTEEIQQQRLNYAQKAAQDWGLTVILKGARSIISDGEKTAINFTGNPGMATAGSGDVLTGFVSGLVAQGIDLFDASMLGTYLHGLAGDIAADFKSELCLLAEDIINHLPDAIHEIIIEEG